MLGISTFQVNTNVLKRPVQDRQKAKKKKPSRQGEIGHRMTVNISKSDKASSITRKEQAKQTKNIGVQGYMKKGETKLSD